MPQFKSHESELWKSIHEAHITEDRLSDLTGFKTGPVNYKLSLWDPQKNGVRYLKTIIYNACDLLTSADWQRLVRTQNRDVGSPMSVRYNGEEVCLDYLQATLELGFLERHVSLEGQRVLEIGAGYGRTCHTIVSNHAVAEYWIVDLANCLALSEQYLSTVLDSERFRLLRFVRAEEIETLTTQRFGLCINIDSFAEMDAEVVRSYLSFIDTHCRHLYVKNPVGKYWDPSLDNHSQGKRMVELALSTGLLTDVIDIYDNEAVVNQSASFRQSYQPADGWQCVDDARAMPWSYYWQAFYTKTDTSKGAC